MKNIALFGGSFDPPHIGHEAIVEALLQREEIDKVVVMPTFLNPFKEKSHASASLRLAWLREIFAPLQKVEVSSFEVDQGRKVPTLESVQHFLQEYESVFLVIGADNLKKLHHWYKYDLLKELVTFIVVSRDNIEIPDDFIELKVEVPISSTKLRANIQIDMLPKVCAKEIEKYYKEKNEQ